jgi:DedD protein
MDPALKQRLIGAAVLVVLAVIFVPMLLDGGSQEPRTETIDLSVPDAPAADFETRVVPLDTTGPTPRPAAAAADAVATVDTDAPERRDALDEVAPAAAPSPSPSPAAPQASATPTTSPTPAASGAEPAPMPARGRYAVSYGSYAKRDNAEALVAALRKAQVQAYAEAVDLDGKPGMRVRSGPYVDRTQAEKARLLAKQARPDVTGTLVEVDDTPARGDVPASAANPVTGWAVQVGAYKNEADAKAQRDRLRGAGFAAYVESIRAETGTLFRVRVGPEADRAGAEKLRDTLKSRMGLAGQVVTHP